MDQDVSLGNMITPKHFVRFYDDDTFLVKEISQYMGAGLRAGHAGIVIATKAHLDDVQRRLTASGYNLAAACERGQYVALDAGETLAKIMVNGVPDERRFDDVVGSLIAEAEPRHSWVRAFGEMVALLCAEENLKAAIHLEKLWNRLSETHSFSLFCAYPISEFNLELNRIRFKDICFEHSHVLLPEQSARRVF